MMDGYGMGTGGWILMVLFWVALLGLIIWAVVRLSVARSGSSPGDLPERPREILDRRLARGEIDADTYDQLRARLAGDK